MLSTYRGKSGTIIPLPSREEKMARKSMGKALFSMGGIKYYNAFMPDTAKQPKIKKQV